MAGEGDPGTVLLDTVADPPYVVDGVLGDPATNYYFLARGVDKCERPSADVSNRTGEFDFPLVPGS